MLVLGISDKFQKIQNMHKICIYYAFKEKCIICIFYAYFLKCLKITFLGISDDSEHF